jgi:hypothetical protein
LCVKTYWSICRYQFRQQSAVDKEELEALGIPVRKNVTLESEFEKVQKEVSDKLLVSLTVFFFFPTRIEHF